MVMKRCTFKTLVILFFLLIVYALATIMLFKSTSIPSMQLEDLLPNSAKWIRKDWNDYVAMASDKVREGPGEQGKGATLKIDTDYELSNITYRKYGFNGYVSDMISVNRSLQDARPKGCRNKKYLVNLPSVSIVIPFYNEYFSVLLRSLHSIVNRTPSELLKEIIIVDDCSQFADLGQKLDQYVAQHFDKVQIVRLPERMGLIRARMAGFRKATAEVYVILDSHIEVNYNWLPPLLELIVINKRAVTSPLIDTIQFKNFQYKNRKRGERGAFGWDFTYRSVHLLPEALIDDTKTFKNPVMLGGLFAISAAFFWELGGYDEGLDIWGGEQFELSFKIWMCGGELLDVPCSRVGHLYRDNNVFKKTSPRRYDYIAKNTKRVAEVWMDQYKEYIYKRVRTNYDTIDAGDLTERKAIRERLKCKSFKWYLEGPAKEVMKFYPPVDPIEYAYGTIQSVATPNLCIDTYNSKDPGLYPCASNLTHPHYQQNFALGFRHDLKLRNTYLCLDSWLMEKNAFIVSVMCHNDGGNQFWYYDRQNKWIIHGENGKRCIEASPKDSRIYVNICDKNNLNMKWNFGFVNNTALDRYFEDV